VSFHHFSKIPNASLCIYFSSSIYLLISHVVSVSRTCIFPPLMHLRKINNHTRSDLFLYYIIHIQGKTNSDSTRRISVSFPFAKKTLGSVETRTALTNSRKCKAVDKNVLQQNGIHFATSIFWNLR
jgi:hypothetical protein